MNEYIIYTTEGHTIAPNEDFEIENCQVLGRVKAANMEAAKSTLLEECPYLFEAGYHIDEAVVVQIVP